MAKFTQPEGVGRPWSGLKRHRPRARFWSTNVGEALGATLVLALIGLALATFP